MIFTSRISCISVILASLFSCNVMAVQTATPQTATPTLQGPANSVTDWLFNSDEGLRWTSIPTATYRVVVSESADFRGFTDSNGGSSCDNTCITAPTTTPSASKVLLANFRWKGRTYFWKVRANTATGGISNWSEVRTFTTTSNPAIPTNAYNAAGNTFPSIKGEPWLTDVSNGDNTRIRNAIANFKIWVDSAAVGGFASWVKKGRQAASANTIRLMNNDLSATYNAADRELLIDRIRSVYANNVPLDDNGLLALLGIRAQCKEFADRIVESAGGTKRAYGAAQAGTNIRPGMYAFKNDNTHAAIITEVYWDTKGSAFAQISESNWGTGWNNPTGQIPWERTVANNRIVSMVNYYASKTGQ